MQVTLGTTKAELLADRAVFLPGSKTLVIADLHLGKSATFRTHGVPVPEGSTTADLSRLRILLSTTGAKTLVVAGDLIHSHDGLTASVLDALHLWLEEIAIPVILTEGNHDRRSPLARRNLPLEIVPDILTDDLIITHDPKDLPHDQPGIAGHLHPGIRLRESRQSSLRLPIFLLRNKNHLILPAFSEFTGLQLVKPTPTDQFYTPLNGGVTAIPHSLLHPTKIS